MKTADIVKKMSPNERANYDTLNIASGIASGLLFAVPLSFGLIRDVVGGAHCDHYSIFIMQVAAGVFLMSRLHSQRRRLLDEVSSRNTYNGGNT